MNVRSLHSFRDLRVHLPCAAGPGSRYGTNRDSPSDLGGYNVFIFRSGESEWENAESRVERN